MDHLNIRSRSKNERRSHRSTRSQKKKSQRINESMPESTRFREKTSEKNLKKYSETNFVQSDFSKKRSEHPDDYYLKKSKEYLRKSGQRSKKQKYERSRSKNQIKNKKSIEFSREGGPERAAYKKKISYRGKGSSNPESNSALRKSKHGTPKKKKSIQPEIKYEKEKFLITRNQDLKISSKPEEQAKGSLRSRSLNFAKHHNNCRCYICTCNRSHHRCPVSKGTGKPFLGNTINRMDFKKHPDRFYLEATNPLGREMNIPKDNLRFAGQFDPKTENRDNYQKHLRESQWRNDFLKDKNFNDFIRMKNNEDHVKNALPSTKVPTRDQHRNYKHGDIDPMYYPLKRYRKSASPIRSSAPFMGRTVYQKDFQEWENHPDERRKPYKYEENLRAYNPEIPIAKFTEYNHANYMHMVNRDFEASKNRNKELFELFKQRDQIPGGVIPKNQGKKPKDSEYRENYKKWKIPRNDCDLKYMPDVSPNLIDLKEHIYWNKFKDDWTCKQRSYYDN